MFPPPGSGQDCGRGDAVWLPRLGQVETVSGHLLWDLRQNEGLLEVNPVYSQDPPSHASEEVTPAPGSSHCSSVRDSELSQVRSQNHEREDKYCFEALSFSVIYSA